MSLSLWRVLARFTSTSKVHESVRRRSSPLAASSWCEPAVADHFAIRYATTAYLLWGKRSFVDTNTQFVYNDFMYILYCSMHIPGYLAMSFYVPNVTTLHRRNYVGCSQCPLVMFRILINKNCHTDVTCTKADSKGPPCDHCE